MRPARRATARARAPVRRPKPAGAATARGRSTCSRASSGSAAPATSARARARSCATAAATAAAAAASRAMQTINVKRVPPGVDDGTRLRLTGEGEAGVAGGPPGDLYVVISLERHPMFERDGSDMHCQVPVQFVQAALGAEIEVPTLEGKVKLQVPPGTQSGKVMRLRGKGLRRCGPSTRGDELVHIFVETPTKLTGAPARAARGLRRGVRYRCVAGDQGLPRQAARAVRMTALACEASRIAAQPPHVILFVACAGRPRECARHRGRAPRLPRREGEDRDRPAGARSATSSTFLNAPGPTSGSGARAPRRSSPRSRTTAATRTRPHSTATTKVLSAASTRAAKIGDSVRIRAAEIELARGSPDGGVEGAREGARPRGFSDDRSGRSTGSFASAVSDPVAKLRWLARLRPLEGARRRPPALDAEIDGLIYSASTSTQARARDRPDRQRDPAARLQLRRANIALARGGRSTKRAEKRRGSAAASLPKEAAERSASSSCSASASRPGARGPGDAPDADLRRGHAQEGAVDRRRARNDRRGAAAQRVVRALRQRIAEGDPARGRRLRGAAAAAASART